MRCNFGLCQRQKGCASFDLQPFVVGGKTGIRTLGTRKGTTVFETVPIDHSGIFPFSGCAKLRSFGEGDKFFDLFFRVLL